MFWLQVGPQIASSHGKSGTLSDTVHHCRDLTSVSDKWRLNHKCKNVPEKFLKHLKTFKNVAKI